MKFASDVSITLGRLSVSVANTLPSRLKARKIVLSSLFQSFTRVPFESTRQALSNGPAPVSFFILVIHYLMVVDSLVGVS